MNRLNNNRIKINFFSFTLVVLMCLFSAISLAQTVEFTPSYGVQFGSKLNYGVNYLKLKESDQFGITIGVETIDNVMAEIIYIHQGSEIRIRDVIYSPSEGKLTDLAMDWIMVGGTKYFPSGKIRPFAGGSLGLAIFSPSNENFEIVNNSLSSETRFAFAFKGGVNIMFTDVIGLNLQGNLLFPVAWGGAYVGAGSGGVSGGVSVSSTTLIGGFSGGLVFRIN